MDQTLKRLLDAEVRAERIVSQAEAAREKLIRSALLEARAIENRFEARIPELHASFREKAETRAEQTVSELQRRFDERHRQLRNLAEQREPEALEAAFALLVDSDVDA